MFSRGMSRFYPAGFLARCLIYLECKKEGSYDKISDCRAGRLVFPVACTGARRELHQPANPVGNDPMRPAGLASHRRRSERGLQGRAGGDGEIDASLPDAEQGAATGLRDGQRAWITYRDAACATEGYLSHGGSIEPMVVAYCLARLTKARAADVWMLSQKGE